METAKKVPLILGNHPIRGLVLQVWGLIGFRAGFQLEARVRGLSFRVWGFRAYS